MSPDIGPRRVAEAGLGAQAGREISTWRRNPASADFLARAIAMRALPVL